MNVNAKLLILICCLFCCNIFAQVPKSMSDGEKRIYYTDLIDAKNKLIEYHKQRHSKELKDKDEESISLSFFPFEMFKDLVLHDERTFNFDFAFEGITELKSSDNKLKLYCWDNFNGGHTNRIYDGITTYKYDSKYYAYAAVWDELGELSDEQNGNIVTTRLSDIQLITSTLGKTIYLVFYSARYELEIFDEVKAYSLNKGNLIPELIFNVDNQLQFKLSNSYQPNWGSKSVAYMNYSNGVLEISRKWLPEKLKGYTYPIASGLVDIYKYDGHLYKLEKSIYKSTEPLYNDLENFKYNIVGIDLAPYKIRIDYMNNGSYRYSSWKNKKTNEKPDIIIENGLLLESINGEKGVISLKEKYLFENNGYYYIVSFERVVYNRFISIENVKLVVKRNDKILMELNSK